MNSPHELTLAIDGGKPAVTQAPPAWPIADEVIRKAMDQAFAEDTWGTYHGPWLDALIDQLANAFEQSHAICCSSGTVAVELSLRGVGVKTGDEVIVAAYDFPGNFRAIEAVGATPVLVDVVADGWVLDVDLIEAALSPKTTAVLVSHLHGQVADIPLLRRRLAKIGRADVRIVEDVCQAPGARLDDRPLGAFGDASALSFGGSKLLSAGRGGAVLTSDPRIAQRMKIANDRGNETWPLSQLQAIVLGPQIDQLDNLNGERNQNAFRLLKSVETMQSLSGMNQKVRTNVVTPAFFKVPFILKTDRWSREQWLHAAQAEGLPVGSGFRGFANRSERRCRKSGSLDHARIAAAQTVLLHHPILQSDDRTIGQVLHAFQKLDSAINQDLNDE